MRKQIMQTNFSHGFASMRKTGFTLFNNMETSNEIAQLLISLGEELKSKEAYAVAIINDRVKPAVRDKLKEILLGVKEEFSTKHALEKERVGASKKVYIHHVCSFFRSRFPMKTALKSCGLAFLKSLRSWKPTLQL